MGAESRAYAVLVRPIVSEKAALSENRGVYSFAVARGAGKTDIVQAVEDVYGIRPAAVRVMNFDGKTTRFGRQSGRRKDWKKAVVTLPQGKTINIHEGV
ncbi:MAG: 50S ribosomal protein L23 [Candidatus Magasanikbacteria bacterium RIFCSPHIGHO2_02_FULL_51_14]|uniref:Large ribosomal subunit protein uL23 n=1 Tax=Candidatus Magasanikbacteria bacterium RIFCSPHIGHO2_02_FULL_51_14 TaxID=1798683 RepID=A0A1F6MHL2_9BACT|nr:MAG: 50S ribosomal protein L23 [Candidatus Magasanikbacteria bacterium RIFCSPHIGHO2_02_FULL_51_14]